MQTQTHIAIAAALLARPGRPWRNRAVVVGAILPDLSIYVLWSSARAAGIPEGRIWRSLYWSEPWQTIGAIGNSLPIYVFFAVSCWILWRQTHPRNLDDTPSHEAILRHDRRITSIFLIVAAAALLHVAFDFPVHADDAHRHFWPLTDWRFHSPISYWRDASGQLIELATALVALTVLWLRFKSILVRGCLALVIALHVAVPVYFTLTV